MTKKTDLQPTAKLMDLVPLSRFNDYYDFPSTSAMRNLQFMNTYGFADKVIRKVGKRIYVKILK